MKRPRSSAYVARSFSSAISIGCLLLLASALTGAQQPQNAPQLGYVYPAGGQQGTTFRITLGGRFFENASDVFVSGNGVQATVVDHFRPLTPQQLTALREKLQALQTRSTQPGVSREIAALRQQINQSVARNRNPVLSETLTVEVSIAADAEPGARYLRVLTPAGLSRPLVLHVGQLREMSEPVETAPTAPVGTGARGASPAAALSIVDVSLPVVVNGQLIPIEAEIRPAAGRQAQRPMHGDVDRYRFQARAGQQIVLAVDGRSLMPYLADAVPGWLQAAITILDDEGHELAQADDYRFHPDPVLLFRVPHDGDFVVAIADALFRGREDFVYRMTIGEMPYVTSIFPLGGRTDTQTKVELTGWNLESSAAIIDGRGKREGVHAVAGHGAGLRSNPMPFALDDVPDAAEHEHNDSSETANRLTLPVVVNGRIVREGDIDSFSFSGRSGQTIVAEVVARRLQSPLDSSLELLDPAGRRIAFNDDHPTGDGLLTHHADSWLTVKLPANGTYLLRLRDAQGHGGAEYGYRLRVSAPRPDFAVRVAPSAINTAPGGTVPLTVEATRSDGFASDIALSLSAPDGFVLSGGLLPAGQNAIRVTLTSPPFALRQPQNIRIEGRAVIDGREVVHAAVASDEMLQAFAYRHLVTAETLAVHIAGRGGARAPARLLGSLPVKVAVGATATVRVSLPPLRGFQNIQLELNDPPAGISLARVSIGPREAQFEIRADAANVRAGLRSNLIVAISGERVPAQNSAQTAPRRRQPLGFLPALAFEIVAAK